MKSVLALTVSFLIGGTAFAQQPASGANSSSAPIDYEAVRLSRVVDAIRITEEEISLDGRLDEAAWKLASPATDFIQMNPRPGEPARQRTEVRFLYDDTNLYVGVTCFQSEDAPLVVNDLVQDFNFGQSDALNLILDTLHDRRSGFMFMTNPGGPGVTARHPTTVNPGISIGTACGTSKSAGSRKDGSPNSRFRSRRCASPVRRRRNGDST